MATSLEQIITCGVCLRRYTDPRILPCQHTFCLRPCLETIFNPNTRRLRCPLCRQDHLMLKSLAASLPVNRTILNLLDIPVTEEASSSGAAAAGPYPPASTTNDNGSLASGAASVPSSDTHLASVCPICRNALNDPVHCQHCGTNICQTCYSNHTRQVRSDANRNLSHIRRQLPLITECVTLITDRFNNLTTNQSVVLSDMDTAFEELIQIIQRRRRELKEEAEEAFMNEQRRLNSQKETLEVDCATLSSVCQTMGDKLAERNVAMTELIELRATGEDYLRQINNEINENRNLILNETLKRAQFHHDLSQIRPCLLSMGSVLWSERSQNDSVQNCNSPQMSQDRLYFGPSRISRPTPGGTSLLSRVGNSRSTPAVDNQPLQTTFQRLNFQDSPRYQSFSIAQNRLNSQLNSARSVEDSNVSGSVFLSCENPAFRAGRLSRQNAAVGTFSQPRGPGTTNELPTNQNAVSNRVSANEERNSSTNRHANSNNATDNQLSQSATVPENGRESNEEGDRHNGSSEQVSDSASANEIIDLENTQPRCRERTFVLDRLPRPIAFEISGDSSNANTVTETSSVNRYSEKSIPLMVFGEKGSGNGQFCWPRGVSVARESSGEKIVVADSSNHRIQIFSNTGEFVSSHGSYGSGDGEFECLSGLAVDGMGQMIASDRYNHRLIVLNRQGRYVLQVGEPGSREGQLSYPWGVATDQLGFIYVCDKDNHRVQVFTQNGIYVRHFGGMGKNPGEFENPHYLAVALDGRIYVSDTSNNRIQAFDPRGNFLFKFGTEGTGPAQLKYPRGIAIDDDGNVVVADSGNNRIQIFTAAGQFVYSFGAHGSGLGQFKGLEGVALFADGKIVVSDRDNHRIQVF